MSSGLRLKNPQDFIDSKGFVIHQGESGAGDSLQRTGMMLIFSDLPHEKRFVWACGVWELANIQGEPCRHWDVSSWPGKTGYMSRDNLLPMFCLFLIMDLKVTSRQLFNKILARAGFLWNIKHIGQPDSDTSTKIPDFIGLMLPLMYLRASFIGWVVQPISDLYLLILVINRIHLARYDWDDVGDDLNLTVLCETARTIKPTVFTRIILKLYKSKRPIGGPSFEPRKDSGLYQALRWYFHQPEAPPLDVIMIDHIERNWP